MIYKLPDLPYPYDALEPNIDARTMEIHHTKHHAGYVANLNKAIEGLNLGQPTIEELLTDIHTLPEDIQTAVRNHGGGHANHSLFWTILSSRGGGQPRGELALAIDTQLGGFGRFSDEFTRVALGRFGSGWAWLCLNHNGKLLLESTPNQDSPVMYGHQPILGLDVLGTCVLPEVSEPPGGLCEGVLQRSGLERRHRALPGGSTARTDCPCRLERRRRTGFIF